MTSIKMQTIATDSDRGCIVTHPEFATTSDATIIAGNGNQVESRTPRKLSSISKLYDINGDGKLDAAESAMRDMDVSNRGFLTNDKIYALMQAQMETRKQLVRIKWVVFG